MSKVYGKNPQKFEDTAPRVGDEVRHTEKYLCASVTQVSERGGVIRVHGDWRDSDGTVVLAGVGFSPDALTLLSRRQAIGRTVTGVTMKEIRAPAARFSSIPHVTAPRRGITVKIDIDWD